MFWFEAINRPGAGEMQFARRLLESRPALARIPDQSLIVDALEGADHIAATRGDDYAFVYSAQGRAFTMNLGKISGARLTYRWFNPRSGDSSPASELENTGTHQFTPPSQGFGSDWILIVDDAAKQYRVP
jgi:hypothetical protein